MGYKSPLNSKHSPKLWFKFPIVSAVQLTGFCGENRRSLRTHADPLRSGTVGRGAWLSADQGPQGLTSPKKEGWRNAGFTMKHADKCWFYHETC